jgi:hypothetical protein
VIRPAYEGAHESEEEQMKDVHDLRKVSLPRSAMLAPAAINSTVANGQASSRDEQPDEITAVENRIAGPKRPGKLLTFVMAGAVGLACALVGTSTAKADDTVYWNGSGNTYAFNPYYYNNYYDDYGDNFYAPYAYPNAYSYPFIPSFGVGMIYGGGGYPHYDRGPYGWPGWNRDHRDVYGRQSGRFHYGWY